jgi:hypothetical protein
MSRIEGPMQQRIREATEVALKSAGYSRYDDGTLRRPPETHEAADERYLAEEAERLLAPMSEEESAVRLDQLIALHKAGLVSTHAIMSEMGLEFDDPAQEKK